MIPLSTSFSYIHLSNSDKVDFLVAFSTCGIWRDYSKTYARSKYYDEAKPWSERCDVAFPCASQNEIDQSDAINLVNSGCRILVEGSSPSNNLVPSSTYYFLT